MFFACILVILFFVSVVYNWIQDSIDGRDSEWNSADLDDELKRAYKEYEDLDGRF